MSELPCGLDHHIPTKADRNTITAEFEQFLSESIKRYLTHSWTKKVGQRKLDKERQNFVVPVKSTSMLKFQTTTREFCLNLKILPS